MSSMQLLMLRSFCGSSEREGFPLVSGLNISQVKSLNTSSFEPHNDCFSSYLGSSNRVQNDYLEPGSSISVLRSNFTSIGQILRPPLRNTLCRFSLSYGKTLLHRALSGQRTRSIPQTRNPPTMPWINLSSKEYWTMCHTSVRGCY